MPSRFCFKFACTFVIAAFLYFPVQLVAAPKIKCLQPEFNFGNKESGTNVTGTFQITNQGDEPLEISKLLPGCGCTAARISQKVIPPGKQATITAVLSLKFQKGAMRKDVVVRSNDPTTPNYILYLVGNAVSPIRIEPERLVLGEIDAHAGGEYVINLVAPGPEKKFHITGVEVGDKESLSARYEEIKKNMAYRVYISVDKHMTPGKFHSFVRIRTSNPQFNLIGVAITARVVGELTVSPSRVKVFNPQDQVGVTRYITIGPRKVKKFKVLGIQSPDPSLVTEITKGKDGRYRISIDGLKPSKELNRKNFIIKTDVPEMSAIRIPINVVNTGHPPIKKPSPALVKKQPSPVLSDLPNRSPTKKPLPSTPANLPKKTISNASGGPKLICKNPSYNFGEKEVGESVEHTFVVKNIGNSPANLKNLRTSCGCALLSTNQDILAPGEKTFMTLKVTLDTQGGPFYKNLTISPKDTTQDNTLNLTFEGTLISNLYVLPKQVELGQIDIDQEVTRSVTVVFAQENPVKITRVMSDVNAMVSEIKTLKEGGLYRVIVRVKVPHGNSSKIDSKILLYTDSVKYPMIEIPVTGEIAVDLVTTPNEIVLVDPDRPVTRSVLIRSPKNQSFKVMGVQCPIESIKAKVKPLGTVGYRIELSGLTATPDLQDKSILIKTDLPSFSTIQIPLRVKNTTKAKIPIFTKERPVAKNALRLDRQAINYGMVQIGKPIEHTFRLFNASAETRHILKVTPGCSCAKVLNFSKDIAPQSWGIVTVLLDTTGNAGLRQSSVLIETDDPVMPRFNPLLSCQVQPAIKVEPSQLSFVSKESSIFSPQTIEIVGLRSNEKIAIEKIETSDPMILVTAKTIDEHKRFLLKVTVNKDIPTGVTLAHLILHIKGSAQKQIWFPITVINENNLKAEPAELKLFAGTSQPQTVEFIVKSQNNSSITVKKVRLNDMVLNPVYQEIAKNAVRVRLENLTITQSLNLKHVHVSTNQGELRIPISVRILPNPKRVTPVSLPSILPDNAVKN